MPITGYHHVFLNDDGTLPVAGLAECKAIINAAGAVKGDRSMLEQANIRLPVAIAGSAKAAGVPKMVQVSSFSVFGSIEHIDRTTPEQPTGDYGRSKLEGDRALQAIADDDFAVQSLRLPFMFSASHPGLFGPLLSIADVFRILPDVRGSSIRRSMITYATAAQTLIECASNWRNGIAMAADRAEFSYPLLTRLLFEHAGKRVAIVPVPQAASRSVSVLVPGIGRRLFRSSLLDPSANETSSNTSDLETTLRKLIENRYRT